MGGLGCWWRWGGSGWAAGVLIWMWCTSSRGALPYVGGPIPDMNVDAGGWGWVVGDGWGRPAGREGGGVSGLGTVRLGGLGDFTHR